MHCVADTTDDHVVVGCGSGEILVYEKGQGRLLRVLHGHRDGVRSLAASNTGYLASGGEDGTVRLWSRFTDANFGEQDGVGFGVSLSVHGFGRSLAYCEGDLVTGGVDGTVRRVDEATETTVWERQLPHWVLGLVPARGGRTVFATWQSYFVELDAATGNPVGEQGLLTGFAYARRVVADAAGMRVFLLDRTGNLTTLDLDTGRQSSPVLACTIVPGDNCGALVFDEASNSLWTGGHDGTVRCFDADRLVERWRFAADGPITCLTADPAGVLVATWDERSKKGQLTRRRVPDGMPVSAMAIVSAVLAVADVPGRLVVARLDGRLAFHRSVDLSPIVVLAQPAAVLWNVLAAPDGNWLAVQCRDREPRILRSVASHALTEAHQRARAAEARAAAARALLETGWVPFAARELASRTDLDPEIRAAAQEALPPNSAWRIAADSMSLGLSPDSDLDRIRARYVLLLEVVATTDDDHRASSKACLAMFDLRLGRLETAMRWLDDPAFAPDGELVSVAAPHFVRACYHIERGDLEAADASLASLRLYAYNAPSDRGYDLVREAEAKLAAARARR
ncbi:MAG: PQQ-binding-like beta-propeller repeat protein [Planctomycetes bacterium]|nr:PQQ-binding-like beta-propeller repeat protein [Planctomycetota bacterium]